MMVSSSIPGSYKKYFKFKHPNTNTFDNIFGANRRRTFYYLIAYMAIYFENYYFTAFT